MAARRQPILIEQGASFTVRARVEVGDTPLNVLGYSARLTVFRKYLPLVPPVLDLSDDDGNEVVFEAGGLITFTATSDKTASIPVARGRHYYYDASLISPEGHVYRLLEGPAVVSQGRSHV